MDVRVVALAAQSILAAARSHKRAAAVHSRQAKNLMGQFEELRRLLEREGVTLDFHDHTDPDRRAS